MKDVAVVKTAVLFRRRLDCLLSDDARRLAFENDCLDLIAAGDNTDVARVNELGEVEVVSVGAILGDVTVDSDKVARRYVCEGSFTEDVNTVTVSQESSSLFTTGILPLRGAVIVVRLRRADPETIGTLGSDKTSHIYNAWIEEVSFAIRNRIDETSYQCHSEETSTYLR